MVVIKCLPKNMVNLQINTVCVQICITQSRQIFIKQEISNTRFLLWINDADGEEE